MNYVQDESMLGICHLVPVFSYFDSNFEIHPLKGKRKQKTKETIRS